MCHSFELGGEKKTKGAALTFVSVKLPLATDAEHTWNRYSDPFALSSLLSLCIQSIMRRNTHMHKQKLSLCAILYQSENAFTFQNNRSYCHLTD